MCYSDVITVIRAGLRRPHKCPKLATPGATVLRRSEDTKNGTSGKINLQV